MVKRLQMTHCYWADGCDMNKKVASMVSLSLFFVGVMVLAVTIVQNNGHAYHAFALCAILSVLADFLSMKTGNKMPTATLGQKQFVLLFQSVTWAIGLVLIHHFKLFHVS